MIVHAEASWDRGYRSDEERWAAICDRDRGADSHFVYAVATTGIFCRPSCPSRRAKRENVSFYSDAPKALAAGFRACRRCNPAEASAGNSEADLVAAACRHIDAAATTPTLLQLSAEAGLSPSHFHRMFKRVTGLTPRGYAAARKDARVKEKLAAGSSVTHALYAAGYGSSSRFYESARGRLGMTPTRYSAGGREETIGFAVSDCSLGYVLVAATDKGICDVRIGDDPAQLVDALRERFAQANVISDERLRSVVEAVVATIENPNNRAAELPLDIRGTIFQQRVWEALSEIPLGETASYKEIAARIDQPSATRAVAQACGANNIAILVPCHRVVRSDGTAGGYRWGVERKRALLEREAPRSAKPAQA